MRIKKKREKEAPMKSLHFTPQTEGQAEYIRSISENDITFCTGPAGTGKAQPLDSLVYTPSGPKKIGDCKIGDIVLTPDGKTAPIIGIYPQGIKDVFRLTFKCGSVVECCKEHLWPVNRINGEVYNKILSLEEIMSKIWKNKNGFTLNPIKYANFNSQPIKIDPYLLGVILGDGCIMKNTVSLSSIDEPLLNECNTILSQYNCKLKQVQQSNNYRIIIKNKKVNKFNQLLILLNQYGLNNKKSYEKFIPENYIYNNLNVRIGILQGLMDTDGSITTGGTCEYSTTSKLLGQQVKILVESLGGTCRIVERITNYTYKGIKKQGRLSYRCYIKLENYSLFRLKRKKERTYTYQKYFTQRICTNIEKIEPKVCVCIEIDSQEHLYITDNFIPTHNTMMATLMGLQYLLNKDFDRMVITRPIPMNGKGLGFLPGALDEKLGPYLIPIYDYLKENLQTSDLLTKFSVGVSSYKSNPKIEVTSFQYLIGRTFKHSYILSDETQFASHDELMCLLTRFGQNSKMVINGDISQRTYQIERGMEYFMQKLDGLKSIGIVHLTEEDIVRHELIGRILNRLK